MPQAKDVRVFDVCDYVQVLQQLKGLYLRVVANALVPTQLLKVDTEGFECKALQGARRLMLSGAVHRITAESNVGMLQRMGCSAPQLRHLLVAGGAYNVSLRPTMTESTFIAQHVHGPRVVCTGHFGCGNAPIMSYSDPGWRAPGTIMWD